MTTLANPHNLTSIATGSGTALQAVNTETGFTITGTGAISTSASGSTITISGTGGTGIVVQQVRYSSTAVLGSASIASITTSTTPTTGNTTSIISLSITPTSTSNTLIFDYSSTQFLGSQNGAGMFLFDGSTLLYSTMALSYLNPSQMTWRWYYTVPATTSQTYNIRIAPVAASGSSAYYISGGSGGGAMFNSTATTTFTITEVTS